MSKWNEPSAKLADPEAEHTKMVGNAMKLVRPTTVEMIVLANGQLRYFPKALQEGLEGRAGESFSTARRASVKLQQ